METELRVKVPEGMEIDKEHSTFECIKFKPKKLTYSYISSTMSPHNHIVYTNERHQQKCVTFVRIIEVADYLNGDWKPDWNNGEQRKYFICYNHFSRTVDVDSYYRCSFNAVCFSSEENARKAIEIIGEEELKKFFL